jgi:hypothetical protein
MVDDVLVSCIRKRGDHFDPHERIEGLGGTHNGERWYLKEDEIIAELDKSPLYRRWNFFTLVNGHRADVVVATHSGRKYLKTKPDNYSPDNLLSLPDCP